MRFEQPTETVWRTPQLSPLLPSQCSGIRFSVTHFPHLPRFTSMSVNQSRGKTLTLRTQGLTSHGEDHTTNSTLKPVKSRSHWNRLLNGYRARVTVEGTWPTLLAVAMTTSGYSPDQRAGVWPKAHEPWAQISKQLKTALLAGHNTLLLSRVPSLRELRQCSAHACPGVLPQLTSMSVFNPTFHY